MLLWCLILVRETTVYRSQMASLSSYLVSVQRQDYFLTGELTETDAAVMCAALEGAATASLMVRYFSPDYGGSMF
jgi:hypothetical protein